MISLIEKKTFCPEVSVQHYEVRDPKDSPIVATAVSANCDYIVTGDVDLLELGVVEKVAVVTPAEFLDSVG